MSKRKKRRINAANRERKRQMAAATTAAQTDDTSRRVTFMKDTVLQYPELWLEVFVAGSPYEEKQFAEMFVRSRCRKAATPEEADLVVFSGGPDVDPLLYGEKAHRSTRTDVPRDKRDIELYDLCFKLGIPMLGICRGAQFLHVMNGGKLYQDVDNHYGDHDVWDIKNKQLVRGISSVHHQLVMENPEGGMEVIAFCSGKSKTRHRNNLDFETGSNRDIEAFFYRDTCSIGIQGHPEYRGYNAFTKWSLDLLNQLVMENPDLEYREKKCRMKLELLAQREQLKQKEMN